jgi:hypothetical protein
MDQLQQLGFKLVYDPDFVVLRRPRSSLRAFCRMLLTYGRGRAEQFRVHPTFGSVLNFVPPLFCLYLISLPLVLPLLGGLGALPLALYCIAVVSENHGAGESGRFDPRPCRDAIARVGPRSLRDRLLSRPGDDIEAGRERPRGASVD